MMAFLIIAHNEPKHLLRLAKRLISEHSAVFIHIDAKSNIDSFSQVFEIGAISTKKRHRVYWGGWSVVAATLELISTALDDRREFSHFSLISGVDYPLASPDFILEYVKESGCEHIDCRQMPCETTHKPLSRLSVRHLEGGHRTTGILSNIVKVLNKFLARLPPRDLGRALKNNLPYAGTNWWIITRKSAIKSLEISRENSSIVRLFRISDCPDESYFQTVIVASSGISQIARSVTYTDWSGPNPPRIIDDTHVNLLTNVDFRLNDIYGTGACLFVRKFPVERHDLADRIDDYAARRTV